MLPPHWSNDLASYIGTLLRTASLLGHALHAVAILGGLDATIFYRWGEPA